jgi:hypothetical protein
MDLRGEAGRGAYHTARAADWSCTPLISWLRRQLHWPSVWKAMVGTLVLAGLIVIGSRNLADFDSALVGYTFAVLFATFGLIYRYSVWLSKPPTRRHWRRGWQLLFTGSHLTFRERWTVLIKAIFSRILIQDFVFRRGARRYVGHMLLAWGCILAAIVTFPLVFGWIHFEQGQIEPVPTYRVIFFGFHVDDMPLTGFKSWFAFHALVVSGFMVVGGVMIVMFRRMFDMGAVAVERFSRDFLPLILLFAIAVSGLLLWVSYEWFNGQFYNALAQFHAITVITTLVYLPFGKLFHIFQRPASLGIALYRAAGEQGDPAVCPVTTEPFAPKLQTEDLKEVLPELGFDYSAPGGADRPAWNEVSPRGRRILIGRAHNAVRGGKFD